MNMDKEFIQYLSQAKSTTGGTSLVTMYIPGNTDLWLVSSTLSSELSTSQNIKSKPVKKGVQSALKAAQNQIKMWNGSKAPSNGLVLCSGDIMEGKSCF